MEVFAKPSSRRPRAAKAFAVAHVGLAEGWNSHAGNPGLIDVCCYTYAADARARSLDHSRSDEAPALKSFAVDSTKKDAYSKCRSGTLR